MKELQKLHDLQDHTSRIKKCDYCYRYAIHQYLEDVLCWQCYEKKSQIEPGAPKTYRLIKLNEETRWGL